MQKGGMILRVEMDGWMQLAGAERAREVSGKRVGLAQTHSFERVCVSGGGGGGGDRGWMWQGVLFLLLVHILEGAHGLGFL